MRVRVALTATAIGTLLIAGCADDDGDAAEGATTTTEGAVTTTTVAESTTTTPTEESESTTVPAADGEFDVALGWELKGGFEGFLRNPVTFGDGFAAVYSPDGAPIGELWTSVDGVEWGPAADAPVDRVESLVAYDGDLFVETSAGLWALRQDDGWREVITDSEIARLGTAVGPDRIVAYRQGTAVAGLIFPFEILATFDTTTLDAVDFDGLPEVDIDGTAREGHVIALDEGFLAEQTWSTTSGESERRVFHSADGSTWVEHPTATANSVHVGGTAFWTGPVFYNGINLIAGPAGPADTLVVTDDGLALDEVPSPVLFPNVVTSTEAGFFIVGHSGGLAEIHHSTDGREWQRLETPPTWSDGGVGDVTVVNGSVMVAGEDLYSIEVRGLLQGFGGVEDPVTEIWRTDLLDITTGTSHEIGEPVQISEGQTLTLTSIDADPEPICAPTQSARSGNEARYVLVRGTLEGDSRTLRGVDAFLVPGSQRPPDAWDSPGHVATPEVVERSDNAIELEWCFFVAPDKPTWTFLTPLAIFYPEDYPPVAWDVNF